MLHIKLLHLLLLLDAHLGAHGSAPQRTRGEGTSPHARGCTGLSTCAYMRGDGGTPDTPNSRGGASGGPAALLPLDSLLAHRAARLFWTQHFGRHEAVVRWRELRDALQQEFGKLPHGVLHEIRSKASDQSAAALLSTAHAATYLTLEAHLFARGGPLGPSRGPPPPICQSERGCSGAPRAASSSPMPPRSAKQVRR